ncbi:hypothetical protein PInf_010339 [Phytophthora infestans]|nr:hypothetical protein PInf_010339 [Phytophthora infestans]
MAPHHHHMEKLNSLNSVLERLDISEKLSAEIRRFYHHAFTGRKQAYESQLLSHLPDQLCYEISSLLHSESVKSVALFDSASIEFLKEVTGKFRHRIYQNGDSICLEGDVCREFFVLLHGSKVNVFFRSRKVPIRGLHEGDSFGVLAFLLRRPHPATLTAASLVHASVMTREQFDVVQRKFDDDLKDMKEEAQTLWTEQQKNMRRIVRNLEKLKLQPHIMSTSTLFYQGDPSTASAVSGAKDSKVARDVNATRELLSSLWKTIVVLCNVYNTIFVIVRICFHSHLHFSSGANAAVWIADICCDICFALDIYLRLYYFECPDVGLENLVERKETDKQYRRSMTLKWDMLASVPIYAPFASGSLVASLCRLPRLVRCVDLWSYLDDAIILIQQHFASHSVSAYLSPLKLMIILVLVAHYVGCIFFWISEHECEHVQKCWVKNDHMLHQYHHSVLMLYAKSFYWAITTLLLVGSRESVPRDTAGTVWTGLTCLLCTFIIGHVVGEISELILELGKEVKHYKSRITSFDGFAKEHELSDGLRKRVGFFFREQFEHSKGSDLHHTVHDLSANLRLKLMLEIYGDSIKLLPISRFLTSAQINNLAIRLKSEIFIPGDNILVEGTFGSRLSILMEGALFGEVAFFLSGQRRLATVRATTACEVLFVSKHDWQELWTSTGDMSDLQIQKHAQHAIFHWVRFRLLRYQRASLRAASKAKRLLSSRHSLHSTAAAAAGTAKAKTRLSAVLLNHRESSDVGVSTLTNLTSPPSVTTLDIRLVQFMIDTNPINKYVRDVLSDEHVRGIEKECWTRCKLLAVAQYGVSRLLEELAPSDTIFTQSSSASASADQRSPVKIQPAKNITLHRTRSLRYDEISSRKHSVDELVAAASNRRGSGPKAANKWKAVAVAAAPRLSSLFSKENFGGLRGRRMSIQAQESRDVPQSDQTARLSRMVRCHSLPQFGREFFDEMRRNDTSYLAVNNTQLGFDFETLQRSQRPQHSMQLQLFQRYRAWKDRKQATVSPEHQHMSSPRILSDAIPRTASTLTDRSAAMGSRLQLASQQALHMAKTELKAKKFIRDVQLMARLWDLAMLIVAVYHSIITPFKLHDTRKWRLCSGKLTAAWNSTSTDFLIYDRKAQVDEEVLYFLKRLLSYLTMGHLLACMWYLTSYVGFHRYGTSWLATSGMLTYIKEAEHAEETERRLSEAVGSFSLEAISVSRKYLRSLLFSMECISTLFYGDILSMNPLELVAEIAITLWAIYIYGALVGAQGELLDARAKREAAFEQTLGELHHYLVHNDVPKAIKRQIKVYYARLWARRKGEAEFAAVAAFRGLDDQFLRALLVCLHYVVCSAREEVFVLGDMDRSMYFIAQGRVAVKMGSSETIREHGEFFGELALLYGISRLETCAAVTVTEMYRLDHEPYERLLLEFPEYRARNKLSWTTISTGSSKERSIIEEALRCFKQCGKARNPGLQGPSSQVPTLLNRESIAVNAERIDAQLPQSYIYRSAMELLSRLNKVDPLEAKDLYLKSRYGARRQLKTALGIATARLEQEEDAVRSFHSSPPTPREKSLHEHHSDSLKHMEAVVEELSRPTEHQRTETLKKLFERALDK